MLAKLMKYHDPAQSQRHKRIYAAYELWYTIVDVGAGLCFLIGSLLFFSEETKTVGTCLFVAGSALFVIKPTIRLMREARYAAIGDLDTLAQRAGLRPERGKRS